MRVNLITPASLEPVTLDELKLHLKPADEDTTEDEYLEGLITTAREHAEDVTRRAILSQTWDLYLDEFPSEEFIDLPFGNLQTITSIAYKDSDGVSTSMTETTDYLVELNGEQVGRIVLAYGQTWPSFTAYPSNPITIRFVCGWTTAALVPYRIKAAIKMLCSDLYEMRGEPVLGQTVSENKTVERLLWPCRLWGTL